MTTVYNKQTGEKREVEGVDAREYVRNGGWSFEPVIIDQPEVEAVAVEDETPEPKATPEDQPEPKKGLKKNGSNSRN